MSMLAELNLTCLMRPQRLPRISGNYAPEKPVSASSIARSLFTLKEASSTGLSRSLWSKEVILQITMAQEGSPSTDKHLMMKTLFVNTPNQGCSQWPTQAPTPMAVNSSSQWCPAPGSTASTVCSERSKMDLTLLIN